MTLEILYTEDELLVEDSNDSNPSWEDVLYKEPDIDLGKERAKNLEKILSDLGIDELDFLPKELTTGLRKQISKLEPKKAYPNYSYFPSNKTYDIKKWVQAVHQMYELEKNGSPRIESLSSISSNWGEIEVRDFVRWLKFYEEKNQDKYKVATAQAWYEGGNGYYLPLKQPSTDPVPTKEEEEEEEPKLDDDKELREQEEKQKIDKAKKSLLSRLHSAEKILTTEGGQLFAGSEFGKLVEILSLLKQKVLTLSNFKRTKAFNDASNDLIIREANILTKNGYVDSGIFLCSLAEEADKKSEKINQPPTSAPSTPTPNKPEQKPSPPSQNPTPPAQTSSPTPATPPAPTETKGVAGTLPSEVPGQGTSDNNTPSSFSGMEGFLKNINPTKDINKSDNEEDEIVIEAQDVAPQKPITSPQPIKSEEVIVEKPAISPAPDKDFDAIIDSAFENLKVDDVIKKLEDLSKIFKVREVPKQLSIVDLMLDRLGMSSFFPALAEATNKSLESNNYISTRIDDVLSKLRGAVKGREIDLKDETSIISEEAAAVRKNLEQQEAKEIQKKERKKDLEDKAFELQTEEEPLEVSEDDLQKPEPIKPATPATPAIPQQAPVK